MMHRATVQVTNVSKRFRLGETHDSLRDLVAGAMRRVIRSLSRPSRLASDLSEERAHREWFWALRNVSLTVEEGEAVGIIGPNGAGKSTMLKLLAGILRADRGEVIVKGRLAALIEVGAGFHGDLTGRENVFLNGAILGMTRREIRQKLDAIVAFAGIGRFLDMPVKRYSSGMYARLGFSIAAHVDPDVLLVDEVLSVGDAVFRLRCLERMRELVSNGTTLVFVTHNLDQMQAICQRALVLENGKCFFEGPPSDAVRHYMDTMSRAYAVRPSDVTAEGTDKYAAVSLLRFVFVNEAGDEVVWIRPHEPVRAEVTFRLDRPVHRLVVELNMRASVQENVISLNSERDGLTFDARTGVHSVSLGLPRIPLAGGQYFWNVRMWDAETGETLLDTPFTRPMSIDDEGRAAGLVAIEREWVFSPQTTEVTPVKSGTPVAPALRAEKADENLLLR